MIIITIIIIIIITIIIMFAEILWNLTAFEGLMVRFELGLAHNKQQALTWTMVSLIWNDFRLICSGKK